MPEAQQQPSIGRVVHYTSYGTPGGEYASKCRAAIVTAVNDGTATLVDMDPANGELSREKVSTGPGTVSLCVLNPTGLFFNEVVWQDETNHAGGMWHWPERTN